MKVYIIYRLDDYAIPQAMSLSRNEAEKFMKIFQEHDSYKHNYWIEEEPINDGIIKI